MVKPSHLFNYLKPTTKYMKEPLYIHISIEELQLVRSSNRSCQLFNSDNMNRRCTVRSLAIQVFLAIIFFTLTCTLDAHLKKFFLINWLFRKILFSFTAFIKDDIFTFCLNTYFWSTSHKSWTTTAQANEFRSNLKSNFILKVLINKLFSSFTALQLLSNN